jgi:hypothetical protein
VSTHDSGIYGSTDVEIFSKHVFQRLRALRHRGQRANQTYRNQANEFFHILHILFVCKIEFREAIIPP